MAHLLERTLRPELMDEPGLSFPATARALADLDRVNRWLLGSGASRRALMPLLISGPSTQRLIDLGTGSGQIAEGLTAAAARRGIELRVIGVDRKLDHLLFGRRCGHAQLAVVAAADRLPFRDNSAHWTFSNLFFHHFTARDNGRILAEMRRVASHRALVVDLRRSSLARVLVRLCLPLLRVGPVASYDGKLSADQAWRLGDVVQLTAELPVIELRRRFPFRFSLVLPGGD